MLLAFATLELLVELSLLLLELLSCVEFCLFLEVTVNSIFDLGRLLCHLGTLFGIFQEINLFLAPGFKEATFAKHFGRVGLIDFGKEALVGGG